MQEWIAISGSPKATVPMVQYAIKSARRAIENNWFIVIGDNPEGIDRAIVELLIEKKYTDWTCVRIQGEAPRVATRLLTRKPVSSLHRFEDYHNRDLSMCDSADRGMFIWDGQSKGTKAAYEHMVSLQKTSYLAKFFGEKIKMTSYEAPKVIFEVAPVLEVVQMDMFGKRRVSGE